MKYIPVKINFGTNHKAVAKKVYALLKPQMANAPKGFPKVSLSGATLTYVMPEGYPMFYLQYMIPSLMMQAGIEHDQINNLIHNGDYFLGNVGRKPVNGYKSIIEYNESTSDYRTTPVKKNEVVYVHWFKPATVKGDIKVETPICGSEVETIKVPGFFEGDSLGYYQEPALEVKVPAYSHIDVGIAEKYVQIASQGQNWYSGKIYGGVRYSVSVQLFPEYGYFFSSDSSATVNGESDSVEFLTTRGSGLVDVYGIHAWDRGTTDPETGIVTFKCTECGTTEQYYGYHTGANGSPLGDRASFVAADKAITTMSEDEDIFGMTFSPLNLKSTKQDKTSVTLNWTGSKGAASYLVYGNVCGKENKPLLLTETDQTTYKAEGLTKGTYHKFTVVALRADNRVKSASTLVHVATKGGKVGNYKSVTVKVKKGKKFKKASSATVAAGAALKTKVTAAKASKKLKVKKHVGFRYESSDASIAAAGPDGVITGVAPGTCSICVYAQNGVCKTLKLTVK